MTVRARTLAPFGNDSSDRATMVRGLAFLYAAGATLVVASAALLGSGSGVEPLGLWLPAGLAYATAAVLFALCPRVPLRAIKGVVVAGTLLITSCVVSGGDASAAFALMYVWIALYAFYFFSKLTALAQTIFAGAAYGAAILWSDAVPEPGVHWLMAVGTLTVAGALLGQLTEAARIQTADLAAVARMGAFEDVTEFAHAVCEGLRRSAGADVVLLLEPSRNGGGLRVTGLAGAAEAGLALNAPGALEAIRRAHADAAPQPLRRPDGRFGGSHAGLAQPVLREDEAVGVLVLAWARPRRRVTERIASAATLFAAEAGLAIERHQAQERERERRALEINDTIVQGLVVAKYAASGGQLEQAIRSIDETLDRARRLITRQLDEVGGGQIRPGDLVRDEASG